MDELKRGCQFCGWASVVTRMVQWNKGDVKVRYDGVKVGKKKYVVR